MEHTKTPLNTICGLFPQVSKSGETYYTGQINAGAMEALVDDYSVFVFERTPKVNDKPGVAYPAYTLAVKPRVDNNV